MGSSFDNRTGWFQFEHAAFIAARLIIPLIIQTIRRDPTGSVGIDGAANVSRPDLSGADQIDAEHQATDLAVGGSDLSRRAPTPQVSGLGLFALLVSPVSDGRSAARSRSVSGPWELLMAIAWPTRTRRLASVPRCGLRR
jgi:hypothetical protein